MIDYLKLSQKDFKVAQILYDLYAESNDPLDLNYSAFHLGQALEKKIKYIIGGNSFKYLEINDLIRVIQIYIEKELSYSEKLKEVFPVLSSWDSEARYNDKLDIKIDDYIKIKSLYTKL